MERTRKGMKNLIENERKEGRNRKNKEDSEREEWLKQRRYKRIKNHEGRWITITKVKTEI